MSARGSFRVAAVQGTPAYLDRAGTLEVVVDHVNKAAADGAQLVVFPESFVPGYPDWVWRTKPFHDAAWYARFHDQAVDLDGPALDGVRAAAKSGHIWVALGISERSTSGALYNSVVYIDDDGAIAGLHRKLVATGAERLVWAPGQDSLLTVVDVGGVKVGALICWENYMPLARAAMYAKGIDVLLAPTWDNSDEWVPTLRHIAKEGQVFVIGVTAYLVGEHVPRDVPGADDLYGGADDPLSRGNTAIVAPGGAVLAGPLTGEAGVVTATLDLDQIATGRRLFDSTGHYARPRHPATHRVHEWRTR
ncbi:MAG: Nitrilase/cyanide hydratase and apolipoprotein N-acyltransferase [Frankiales bacterium]|nr:Nitrilase/cyanide hydratase and apolipoprotein N-acyltransferase [Frankiales bacterium]